MVIKARTSKMSNETKVNYTLQDQLLTWYAVINPFNIPSILMSGGRLTDVYYLAPIGVGLALLSIGYTMGGYYWFIVGAWILPGLAGFLRNMYK